MSVSIRAFVAVGLALALAGCTTTAGSGVDSELVTTTATALHPSLPIDPGVTVIPDVQYGTADGTPLILHNIGAGAQEEDILFAYPMTGHFRLSVDAIAALQSLTE